MPIYRVVYYQQEWIPQSVDFVNKVALRDRLLIIFLSGHHEKYKEFQTSTIEIKTLEMRFKHKRNLKTLKISLEIVLCLEFRTESRKDLSLSIWVRVILKILKKKKQH